MPVRYRMETVFMSLGEILESRNVEYYSKCMFNFVRDCQSVSHSDCAIVHTPAVCEIPMAPHPLKQLLLLVF